MPITPNAAQTHILIDTATRVVAKFLYYSNNATMESDALKINAETLSARTFELTVANTATAKFQPGDLLIGQTSEARAYVTEWRRSENIVSVTSITGNTAFTNTEIVLLDRTQDTVTLVLAAAPARELSVESVAFSVSPSLVVDVAFGGRYANGDAYIHSGVLLSGTGYMGKNALPTSISNPAPSATGNIYISTLGQGVSNNVSYSVIAEFRKLGGFAAKPGY